MAISKTKSATAAEHNAEAEDDRQAARESDSNVVDLLNAAERRMVEDNESKLTANVLDDLYDQMEDLRDQAKALKDDYLAKGRDWAGLVAMVKLRRLDAEKRRKAEDKARRQREEEAKVRRAFGWADGSQISLLDDGPAEGLIPGQQREFLGETERNLAADGEVELEIEIVDEPEDDGDEFNSLLEQAGVATVHTDD